MNFIDPTGMHGKSFDDDYGLDNNGNISLLRKTDDATDKLIALDTKGNETDKSIEVGKGILGNVQAGKTSNGTQFDYMKINNDEVATNLFEFVAENSKVEWSQIKFGSQSSYLSTSHEKHSEAGGGSLMYDLTIGKYSVREHIHSHPTSTTGPSGFHPSHKGKGGDRDYANWIDKYNPLVKLKVYEVKTKKYIEFNKQGVKK